MDTCSGGRRFNISSSSTLCLGYVLSVLIIFINAAAGGGTGMGVLDLTHIISIYFIYMLRFLIHDQSACNSCNPSKTGIKK